MSHGTPARTAALGRLGRAIFGQGRAPAPPVAPPAIGEADIAAQHAFLNRHATSPPIRVDLEARPDELARLVSRIEASWQAFGETEPYWSVLSNPRFRLRRIGDSLHAFFASGERTVGRVQAALARVGAELAPGTRVLDYGCGVGRVAAAFARAGCRVTGVDISAAHLAKAAEHTSGLEVETRRLTRLAEIDSLPEVDLFFSTIVLQHNPPPVMAEILRRALARVAPGGHAWFQLPTYKEGYAYDLAADLEGTAGRMELHVLPQPAVFAILERAGFTPLELRFNDAVGAAAVESTVVFAVRRG